MAGLEDLTIGTRVTGLAASGSPAVESAQWIGEQGLKVIYRDADGGLGERFVYRDDEPSLPSPELGQNGGRVTNVVLAQRSTSSTAYGNSSHGPTLLWRLATPCPTGRSWD